MLDNDTNLEEFQSICIGTQVTLLLLVAITTCFVKIRSLGDRITLPMPALTRIEALVM